MKNRFPLFILLPLTIVALISASAHAAGTQDRYRPFEKYRERRQEYRSNQTKTQNINQPGDYTLFLQHDGLKRKYLLHVPPQYNGTTSLPVVIYLHGSGGNAETAKKDKLNRSADKFGFILLAPEATGESKLGKVRGTWNGGHWDTGTCCGDADDVGFVAQMLDEIEKKLKIDTKRIFATGLSNGGLMTNRLACDLSDRIAAIATVAPAAIPSECHPRRLIPVMDIHGTADTCNPFDGSKPTNPICRNAPYTRMPPQKVLNYWLKANQCSQATEQIYQKGGASCLSYQGCADNAEVVFCKVEGMGHAWPSGMESKMLGVYPVSYDISTDQIWEFFSRHSLP